MLPLLNEFLEWWARHLRDALPPRLAGQRDGAAAAGRGLAIVLHAGAAAAVELVARRKGQGRTLGRFGLDAAGAAALRAAATGQGGPAATLLLLPPDLLLEQEVALPLAAERDLRRVLQYEMDRITPFAADDLFWTCAVTRRDRVHGRLHVRLSLVPKARLAPVLDTLRSAGLRPATIEAPASMLPGGAGGGGDAPSQQRRHIPLHPPQPVRRRAEAWAAAVAAALAVVATSLPFVAQSVTSARIERRIAALRPEVDQADVLRRRILASAAGTDVFAEQRARVGDALGTLAALTDVLPDDTYLNDLTLRGRVLTMVGQSAGAARLVAALAADPGLRNPAFAAPVTRGEGTRVEGFSIRAEVAP